MPVSNLVIQPLAGSLHAAYRPIVLKAQATSTGGDPQPPFVACDIYIADKYYKTMIRTAPDIKNLTNSEYLFDISDALQEYLQPDIAVVDNATLLQAPHMSAKVFCKLRSSGINAEGFTIEEGVIPIQKTKFTEPVSGDGLQSNTFFVINASLQHEDNQDLAEHLTRYKQGTWANDAFPLTHRNKYFFCNDSSDHFPLIFSGPCVQTDLLLNYRLKGQTSFTQIAASDNVSCDPIGFETTINGNRVDVDLDDAIPSGQKVFVQIKLQADSAWTDIGFFTAQSFFFNVLLAGDYDIRIILFCTDCLNSEPETGTFTIAADTNLAWRGINPFCEQVVLGSNIYIELEIRDIDSEDVWFPDDVTPFQHLVRTFGKLYAKFFSDPTHLTPVTVTQSNLKIYVKSLSGITTNSPPFTYYHEHENIITYTVDAAGTEVLLSDEVDTDNTSTNYSGNPAEPGSSSTTTTSYAPFPTDLLIGGNTGYRGFNDLEQYNTITSAPTGVTKPNDSGDPDYIAPVLDTNACPSGPSYTDTYYGFSLQVAKLEIRIGATPPYQYVYYPTVSNTGAGGYSYKREVPKDIPIAITLKVKSLASGVNNDGFISIVVSFEDFTSQQFQIADNIETTLPATFLAVRHINISNN